MTSTWPVTSGEQREAFVALLCAAVYTHHRIGAGERAGIRQAEETITQTTLLDLGLQLPNLRIATHTRRAESVSGADWEWWIEGERRWFGMLVQAKKLHRMDSGADGYGLGYPAASANGDLQVDLLIDLAEANQGYPLAPVYVLYNGTEGRTSHDHCALDVVATIPHAEGITAMSAYTVRGLVENSVTRTGRFPRDVPLDKVRPHAIAWSCLTTCGISCTPSADQQKVPQRWSDSYHDYPDRAERARIAIRTLIDNWLAAPGNDAADVPVPETPLHDRPPGYVPRTLDAWIDGEVQAPPNARHLAVYYRDQPNNNL